MTVLILVFAAYRLTRLSIDDKITEGVRGWVLRRFDPTGKPHYFFTCYWCAGLWVSFGVFIFARIVPGANWILIPLAISAGVGIIAERA